MQEETYVIDKLENLSRYAGISANFAAAVAFLTGGDLKGLSLGRHEIDGERAWANVMDLTLGSLDEKRPEVHHAYFDIQIPLTGEETHGLARFEAGSVGTFDDEKDIGFYDQKVEPVTVRPGEFAIFWPRTCLHAPGCSETGARTIRKIVVKVKSENE